jgi:hypothetical protein
VASNAELRAAGYLPLMASSDLHHVGYIIRHWVRLSDGARVDVYNPRLSKLPRRMATCYAEQCEIHSALGLHVVGPGEQWTRNGQQYLFGGEP